MIRTNEGNDHNHKRTLCNYHCKQTLQLDVGDKVRDIAGSCIPDRHILTLHKTPKNLNMLARVINNSLKKATVQAAHGMPQAEWKMEQMKLDCILPQFRDAKIIRALLWGGAPGNEAIEDHTSIIISG